VRPGSILAVLALAGILATTASASARPVTAQDRVLLSRPATADEKIAQRVAERLTGHANVSVRCLRMHLYFQNVFGVTPMLNGRAFDYFLMEPEACTYLAWFRESPARWDPRSCVPSDCAYVVPITWSLETVAHESYHLLGYTNEAQVDCYGMQSIWFVATRLGASLAEGQAFAQLFWQKLYPLRRTETPLYWSPECRDGGTYDLRKSNVAWPS
jgi:hypothetical protein